MNHGHGAQRRGRVPEDPRLFGTNHFEEPATQLFERIEKKFFGAAIRFAHDSESPSLRGLGPEGRPRRTLSLCRMRTNQELFFANAKRTRGNSHRGELAAPQGLLVCFIPALFPQTGFSRTGVATLGCLNTGTPFSQSRNACQ